MLYKYLNSERIDILKNKSIRFTPFMVLNDPFECRFTLNPIKREKDKAIDDDYLAEWAQVEVWLERRIGQLGMLSMSHTYRNILMWSHYSIDHKGFVLGLDENNDFFRKDAYYEEYPGIRQDLNFQGFGTIRDVRYTQERPNIDFGAPVKFESFFTKSLDWHYEQEARLFRNLTEADSAFGEGINRIHLFNLPQGCIQKVIIGANTDRDVEKEILDTLGDEYFENIVIEKAKINRRKFELDFKLIKKP